MTDKGDTGIEIPEISGDVEASVEISEVGGKAEIQPHDAVRRGLAWALVFLLALIVLGGLVLLAISKGIGLDPTHLNATLQLFFTSVLTLVSTVLGFYFGTEKRRSRDGE